MIMKPVVLVTGASRGIGLAVTRHLLLKFNANVIALSRTHSQDLDALESSSLLFVECDVSNEKALSSAISFGADHFGGIDGIILNAGIMEPVCRIGSSTTLLAWKEHFDVNFFSLVTACNVALPYLRKSQSNGRVIFVSSGAAIKGTPSWGPYNASKAAMNSLCRTLAEEEPEVIAVALRPGMVDTNMQASIRAIGGSHMSEKDYKSFIQVYDDGKLVRPEDCGHVIASLSLQSPKSLSGKFVTWDSEECSAFRPK